VKIEHAFEVDDDPESIYV